jgi:hypothetical protein
MRSMKTFAAAALLVVSAMTTAEGQAARPFRDSWFWGLQTGAVGYTYPDLNDPNLTTVSSFAPTIGLDWLITRHKGGLYVAVSQAFLSTRGLIVNGPTSADSGFRTVEVKNLRRFELAAMAFPGDYLRLHPYVGAGFAFQYIGSAVPDGPYTQQRQVDYAVSAVNEVKAAIGPAFIGGAQYRLKRLSAFGQFTVSTVARDFLLANGKTVSFATQIGVRYNIGTSIER